MIGSKPFLKKGIYMKFITGSVCSKCLCLIFSRYRHDFVECDCKNTFVDGGQTDYTKKGCFDLEYKPYHVHYYIEDNFKGNKIRNWKLNFFNFFWNNNFKESIKAYEHYRNRNEWPDYFPVNHLIFEEGWEKKLLMEIEKQGDDIRTEKIIALPLNVQRKVEDIAVEEKESFDKIVEKAIVNYLNTVNPVNPVNPVNTCTIKEEDKSNQTLKLKEFKKVLEDMKEKIDNIVEFLN